MPFQQGNQFGQGRPKGSPNRYSQEIKDSVEALIKGYTEDFDTVLAQLMETNPGKFAELYLRMLEYAVPKQRAVESTVDFSEGTIEKITVEVKTKPKE